MAELGGWSTCRRLPWPYCAGGGLQGLRRRSFRKGRGPFLLPQSPGVPAHLTVLTAPTPFIEGACPPRYLGHSRLALFALAQVSLARDAPGAATWLPSGLPCLESTPTPSLPDAEGRSGSPESAAVFCNE